MRTVNIMVAVCLAVALLCAFCASACAETAQDSLKEWLDKQAELIPDVPDRSLEQWALALCGSKFNYIGAESFGGLNVGCGAYVLFCDYHFVVGYGGLDECHAFRYPNMDIEQSGTNTVYKPVDFATRFGYAGELLDYLRCNIASVMGDILITIPRDRLGTDDFERSMRNYDVEIIVYNDSSDADVPEGFYMVIYNLMTYEYQLQYHVVEHGD